MPILLIDPILSGKFRCALFTRNKTGKTEGITKTSEIMTAELAQQWIGDMGYIQGKSVAAAALLMNETRSRGFQGNGHKTFTVSVYSLTSAGTGQLKETKPLLFPWLCISYNLKLE